MGQTKTDRKKNGANEIFSEMQLKKPEYKKY
jgi:hypothetical protein